MKLKLILSLSLLILLSFGYIVFKKPEQVAEAQKLSILNGELQSVSQTLGEKNLTNNANLKILFDYDSNYALVGKAWEGETENSESTGGTNLYLLNLHNKSEEKISDLLVRWAILDQKNNFAYFTDLAQDLWRFDIQKNTKEKIMTKVLSPDLSPDGEMMVYQKLNSDWQINNYYDQALGLIILNLATLKEQKITDKWEDWMPIWTLDAKKIVFFSTNDNEHGMSSHYIIDADGQNKKLLTNFGLYDGTQKDAVPMPSEKPVWSPDGSMLAYESDHAIWINKFNKDKTAITESKFVTYGKEPTWIKNGQALNVILNQENQNSIQSINVDLDGKIIK